ncbi:hypothetical protein [Azoarcus taiwanensis]|uniref:CopG-like ribbon-helix-helix domain-containing protein n=1 Tax=Azoarcus taiwanensis TaxID=666964 RepID=A0A972J8H4_9RHOO|nr:hypothetical protein [Azoarcus taiwanensis]NMG03594.1 hypothetical protein [Azoarcus taiwanensis]
MGDVERKTVTVNLRFSPRMKELLRIAAEREHRTLSNMIETLVINYCESRGIPVEPGAKGASRAKKRTTTTTNE